MSSYLQFDLVEYTASGKTKRVQVTNSVNGSLLGWLYWYAGFRKYIFHPAPGAIFDAGCIDGISDELKKMMKEHKQ